MLTQPPDYIPQAYQLYNTYYGTYSPYIAPILRAILLTQSYFYRYIFPTIYPLYTLSNNALHSMSSDSPDLVTLAALAIVFIISIRVLDYMRKTVIGWITFAIKFGMWAAVALVGVYVYQRGVEQSLEDFGWVWGLLQGLGEEGEKVGGAKARGRERDARRMAGAGKRGRTRGGGW